MTAAECRVFVHVAAASWPVCVFVDDVDGIIGDADPSPTMRACVVVISRDGNTNRSRQQTVARFDDFDEAWAYVREVTDGAPDNVTVI